MRILSSHDVAACLDMAGAIEGVREAFVALAEGQVSMPQRAVTDIAPAGGTHLSMPCFAAGALTVKSVTVFPGNAALGLPTTQGVLLLHDAATGAPLALMDAEHLTRLRTGAASALATDLLSDPGAASVLIFGAGAIAKWQLIGMAEVRDLQEVRIVDPDSERASALGRWASEELGVPFVATTRDASVADADIVCCATSSRVPVFDGNDLLPNTHINAVGSFRPEMRELDSAAVARSRVFVDHVPAAQAGAGELIAAAAAGRFAWDQVAGTLGDVIAGTCQGPLEGTITLFKSVGLAVQDAACARRVYERAVALGLGQDVNVSEARTRPEADPRDRN